MRDRADTSANRSEDMPVTTGDVIREALAIQAAKRKPAGPPKPMPKTPTLPKVMKYRKQRRKP